MAPRPCERWTAALATLAAVGGLIAASCSESGDGDVAHASTSSSRPEGTTTTVPAGGYEEPPDGGEIRVVEQGFTPGHSNGDDQVSWGMILENTSDDYVVGPFVTEPQPNGENGVRTYYIVRN